MEIPYVGFDFGEVAWIAHFCGIISNCFHNMKPADSAIICFLVLLAAVSCTCGDASGAIAHQPHVLVVVGEQAVHLVLGRFRRHDRKTTQGKLLVEVVRAPHENDMLLLVQLIGTVDRERRNTESDACGEPSHELLRANHGLDLYREGTRCHRIVQDTCSISGDTLNRVSIQQRFIFTGRPMKSIDAEEFLRMIRFESLHLLESQVP
ncbi:unnamed product [Ostreococcus tauri]|uniref:Unnamed product n=1 Tax=Ostreococcus tauri TaxID=70448 RepID=A0A096P8Q9_OSTTA|nr:unnamed product [Ostreococcus tauri]CEG00249.1 unnamed product [Ostreococcus tauri]|eukprot:XP_022840279.1 unnamed product [Ostreococcus tauri]